MATVKKEVKNKFYSLVRDLTESDKCPPQAKVIVQVLKEVGGKISREDLIAKLKAPGLIKTEQTVERIFGFYRPKLVEMGIMKEEIETSTVEVQVADKPEPAKAEGAAAGAAAPAKEKAAKSDATKGHKGEKVA